MCDVGQIFIILQLHTVVFIYTVIRIIPKIVIYFVFLIELREKK